MNLLVSRLIDFSKKNLELKEDDVCYVSNKVFELLNVENGELVDNDIIDVTLDSNVSYTQNADLSGLLSDITTLISQSFGIINLAIFCKQLSSKSFRL